MEHSRGPAWEKLNRLLEISTLQLRFIREKRIEEFVACQAERERLFMDLGRSGPGGKAPEVRLLAERLLEADNLLTSEVQALMGGISSKLTQVKTGRSALKAYAK
ncbi:MAG: flagellar protein FliT [Deltaproteobacteria bacterium]|nr:flagellar protein FliT [Deltaproteobacteria bacterium]MBZ0219228.1 flagellar protein FliT [Deltaproteobacteria bacterium]